MSDTTRSQPGKRRYAPRMPAHDRREQLLDAVVTIVVEEGVHKVSIDAVARRCDVTRPVVYGHFADTPAMLRASLEREIGRGLEQIADLWPGADPLSATDLALHVVAGFVAAVLEAPDRWRAAFSLVDSSTPQFRHRVEQSRAYVVSVVEEQVRRAAPASADVDVELTARMLVAMVWESGRLALASPQDFPPERIVAFAERTLTTLLGPRPEDPVATS